MELTIEQALQQGIAAHNEGKLQDAERLYRAILQSQPLHPGANHNLGLIAVSVNKNDAALPLFKSALEANPKIEQFWLSYIDVLIKEKQFDNAKQVLEQGKKQGLGGEKVDALEEDLRLITEAPNTTLPEQKNQKKAKKQNLKAISLPETEIKSLLEHYQNGRYDDAYKLAKSVTQQFPEHQFGWRVLGAALKQAGRISESLVPSQKTVQLAPQEAENHYNLGNTLKELGRLDEAAESYTQAIVLKSDFAEAHYNLGNTLKELGMLDEAAASCRQAIALKPDFAEAHNNLGTTLTELGRLDEAAESYTQAIVLKSDFAEAHNNLGTTLNELGRFDEAEASLRQAIELKPDFAEVHCSLGITLKELCRFYEAEVSYMRAIALKSDFAEVHYSLGITLKELGRFDEAEASYMRAIELKSDFAEAHSNLGNTLKELGRFDEAEASYAQAIALKPDYALAHSNLGNTLQELGRLDEAEASYTQAIELKPDFAEVHFSLGEVYKTIGKYGKAEECFEKTLELSSEDLLGATLQLARLGKKKIPDKTPEPYLKEFYRKKSKNWSNDDEKQDGYRGHLLIENAFKKTHNKSKQVEILDLGCGTGSLARFLRPYAHTLVGVDLSPDMLLHAEATGLYDSLYKNDLNQYLGERSNNYDTVVAAAVLIHFFDLDNIFILVKDSLKINGRFIFSIFEDSKKKRDLNSFLMYSHSDDYVSALADRLNLKISLRKRDIHEFHKGAPVRAIIYVLEKIA